MTPDPLVPAPSHAGSAASPAGSDGTVDLPGGPSAGQPAGAVAPGDSPYKAYTEVGVGPHPQPWPDDPWYDPELLATGDARNVEDRFRYWTVEAIRAELDTCRRPLHVAIQNWEHDFNIGSIVRTANAFNVAGVHILGRRRWNKRGALVTDRYLPVYHHPSVASLVDWLDAAGVTLVGIDNVPGSVALETTELPEHVCLLFGSEGPGLTDEAVAACSYVAAITQAGSTRSMNAGAAAAIAMYHWALRWAPLQG